MPLVLHTLTGEVIDHPEHIANHSELRRYFIEVPEGTKNLVPGLFKPGTAEEFAELNRRSDAKDDPDEKDGDD